MSAKALPKQFPEQFLPCEPYEGAHGGPSGSPPFLGLRAINRVDLHAPPRFQATPGRIPLWGSTRTAGANQGASSWQNSPFSKLASARRGGYA